MALKKEPKHVGMYLWRIRTNGTYYGSGLTSSLMILTETRSATRATKKAEAWLKRHEYKDKVNSVLFEGTIDA